MNTPRHIAFRLGALSFAILLALQCMWLLLAELSQSGVDTLPTSAQAAAAAAKERETAAWAAAIGGVRGDLWAEYAFTYADLLWANPNKTPGWNQLLTAAQTNLGRALDNAPHNAGGWLLLGALSQRSSPADPNVTAVLKMSYYTGPSEQELIPLRLLVTAQSDFVKDFEMRQFVSRDLHLLVARKQKSAVAAAYKAASPAGKRFIESVVNSVDPSALEWLSTAVQPSELAN